MEKEADAMRVFASLLLAVVLPPAGTYLARGRCPAFWISLGLFAVAQAVYWIMMAGPGLALWGGSVLYALSAILWGVRGARGNDLALVNCTPWTTFAALGLVLLAAACKDEAEDLDQASVTRGEDQIENCTSCHSLKEGENAVGPSLAGLIGRNAGIIEGYDYSQALRESGLVWTPEQLITYVMDPQAVVPGTKMAAGGFTEEETTDIVTYLRSIN